MLANVRVLHKGARALFAAPGAAVDHDGQMVCVEADSQSTAQRANAIWKQLLREYQQLRLDPAIDEALAEYVARRKRAIENSHSNNSAA